MGRLKEIDIMLCMNEKHEFVGAHMRKRTTKGKLFKVYKKVDFKDRGTLYKHYSRDGRLVATTFLNPNDFWRCMKVLVTNPKPKKKKAKKKNAARN